jgi:hypothetical protein
VRILEVVVGGDFHADKMKGLFPERHLELQVAEQRKSMRYAVKNGIRDYFWPGDIAHLPRLTEEARIALMRLLDEFDGKLNIHIILGNHDVAYEGFHSLQSFVEMYKTGKYKTIFIYDKAQQVMMNGIPVNFLPYPHKKALPHNTKKCDRSINVAHLERPGARRDNGRTIGPKDGTKQKDDNYWFIGHLHTPQSLGNSHFCGTMFQTNFGESLPKGFIHFKAKLKNGKLTVKVDRIPNDPAFKLIPLIVESRKDLKKIEPNPLYLYKVFLKEGVEIKVDLNKKYPNIINTPTTYTDKKKIVLDVGDAEEIRYNLLDGLPKWMKKKGATKKQIKRAQELVKILSN